jgi:hypothetical protein
MSRSKRAARLLELADHVVERLGSAPIFRDYDHIGGSWKEGAVLAKRFAYQPLQAIAPHRITNLTRDGDAEPRTLALADSDLQHEALRVHTSPLLAQAAILEPLSQPIAHL